MKTNLSKRMISLILAIVLLVGVLPTAAFATEEEEATTTTTENVEMAPVGDEEEAVTDEVTEDKLPAEEVVETTTEPVESVEDEAENVTTPAEENVVNATATTTSEDVVSTNYGRTFRMPGRYYDFITSHERFGTYDYLAYVSGDDLIIIFFEDDISDKEFVLTDAWGDDYASGFGASFGYCPQFTSYTYDKNTLELKRTTSDLYPFNGYKFTYTYVSSFDVFWYRYNDPRFYDHAGSLPKIDIPNPPADTENITLGRKFSLPGENVWVLQNCEEYGKKDYLAFVWEEIYVIWFFDDISNVKFYKWDFNNDLNRYFGIKPSRNVPFTKYTFNRSTLKFNEKEELMLNTNNFYGLSYTFDASFDIYWDSSFNRDDMFYDLSGELPAVEVQNPPEAIQNVTNGGKYSLQDKFTWLLQNHDEYGEKDYLTYEWNDDLRIWFFDDISNVKFSVYDKAGDYLINYFGIRPSSDVTFTEYVYNKNTLKFKRVEERSFVTSNGFTFAYPSFMASFDIYWNDDPSLFFDHSATLPRIVPENPPEDLWNFTSGNTFSATGTLLWLLQNHNEYGSEDYIAYKGATGINILFFSHIGNVKFRKQDRFGFRFTISPSEDIAFTEYTYNQDTLRLRQVQEKKLSPTDYILCENPFIASLTIYEDDSYSKKFYDPAQVMPENPTLNPSEDVSTKTNGKTFTLQGTHNWLLVNQDEYGSKNYLASEYENQFKVIFFDDISGIRFSKCNVGDPSVTFGVKPSAQVKYTEYCYSKSNFLLISVTNGSREPDNPFTCSYNNFTASFDICTDESYNQNFYMVNGEEIPTLPPKFVKEEWKEENGQKFHMDEVYLNKIKECPEYKQGQRYLSYLWINDFVIWFFDDPNVQFSVWDRSGNKLRNSFGVNPSVDTQFKAYVFNRSTLSPKSESVNPLGKYSGYTLVYDFVSNIDIYTDESYINYFYKSNDDTVKNTTDSRTFAISNTAYEKIQELIKYDRLEADENYIAFTSDNEFRVWFFVDPAVRVGVKESDASTFKLQPASNTLVWEYVFDRTTMTQTGTEAVITFSKSDGYVFNNNFLANFNIYSDNTYSDYFYDASHSNIEFVKTFQPLKPKEAKEFLRFLTNASWLVNVKKELPEYYNLLIGEIDNPQEELRTKIEFLMFAHYCMGLQLAEWEYQVNWGTGVLQAWLDNRDNLYELPLFNPFSLYDSGSGRIDEEEIKKQTDKLIQDLTTASLERFLDLQDIHYNQDTINGILKGSKEPYENLQLIKVEFALVNIIGVMRAEKKMGDINYLNAHWNLLRAIEHGDPADIAIARGQYAIVDNFKVTFTNPEKMGKYAEYLFSIERSLNNYPF